MKKGHVREMVIAWKECGMVSLLPVKVYFSRLFALYDL